MTIFPKYYHYSRKSDRNTPLSAILSELDVGDKTSVRFYLFRGYPANKQSKVHIRFDALEKNTRIT